MVDAVTQIEEWSALDSGERTKLFESSAVGGDLEPYPDSKGNYTIGYGQNIDSYYITGEGGERFLNPVWKEGGPLSKVMHDNLMVHKSITPAMANELFDAEYLSSTMDIDNRYPVLPPRVKTALIDMRYNMGDAKLRKFTELDKAIRAGNWKQAAWEVLNTKLKDGTIRPSKYSQDVKGRSLENANFICPQCTPEDLGRANWDGQ